MSDLSWPLARAAVVHHDAVAVIDGARRVTYEQLAARVSALAGGLGDDVSVVGYLGANSLAHVECWLGVPASGRVLVDLNYRLALDEFAFMVDDAGVRLLIVDDERADVGRELLSRSASLSWLVAGDEYEPLVSGPPAPLGGVDENALAAISYTGGTTGTPKGVMLSHRNLLANALHNMAVTGHSHVDRWLHVCPMFHVAGTSNLLAATWAGATQVVLPRFEPRAVLDTIAAERITHTVFVPTMLAMLLEADRGDDLSSLRHMQYAASPISAELQARVLARFDCDVAQFYGMTEAAPTVSQLTPLDHRTRPERLSSMGAPVPGVQVELHEVAGEVGELWVRGANVMLGYWNRPDATADALVDGWYRTGDLVRADDAGYLYMVDRAKDMIITGAENVYSVEVEGALLSHPAVVEAAVFGVPDPRWGEAVHAVVVAPGVSAGELVEHCRSRIAGYKLPRAIDVVDGPLPKSGAGKLLKNRLREPYWAGHERRVG
jgi:long-chain acyl-CoA synthetase